VRRIVSALAAAALGTALLGGCGDDGASDAGGDGYCTDLEAATTELDAVQHGDLGGLRDATASMQELAQEAPKELEDAWKVLIDGVDRLVDAIEAAGLSEEDLAGLQSGEIPDGVDMEALEDLMAELKALKTPEFQEATEAITAHAKEECGVDLGA
jgi:hypothetical protein